MKWKSNVTDRTVRKIKVRKIKVRKIKEMDGKVVIVPNVCTPRGIGGCPQRM
jgi:hypothetical protein